LDLLHTKKGDFFFVYGHDSTKKTYLWRTLICRLLSERKIAIAVAFSRITSLLLIGGRTTHSRFQILINVTDSSTCGFKQGSNLVELMTRACLIIWDEVPMAHQNCFKGVDRSLRDILLFSDPESGDKLFGGNIVVLCADFQQILSHFLSF
jgi:hypothetical protein